MLILVAIAIPSMRLLSKQYSPPPADVTVKVTGNQWFWTYSYPDNGGFEIVSNLLKEKADVKPGERFRTDADGPPLLAVDERMVIPAGKVVKFLVTVQRRDPRLLGPGLLEQDRRQPGPGERDLGQGRPSGRLLRPVHRALRRAPRLHADRGRGRFAGAVRRLGRFEGRHSAGRQACRDPGSGSCRGSARSRPAPAEAQPATNQAATAQN